MSYAFPHDIQQQLNQLMATGAFPSEDEVLRQAMTTFAAQQDDLAAVAASLRDFDGGERGISAGESLAVVRRKAI
jgi:Arc/MetJ-type ribon-helix-helix transcriptional regulator